MKILILHQNRFFKVKYDVAIDHENNDVCYAGTQEYLDQIPPGLRCSTLKIELEQPVKEQLQCWMSTQPAFDRILTRQETLLMTAAELREEFNISGMRPAQATLFRDKVAMKQAIAKTGLRVPQHARISPSLNQLSWQGKTVLKPVDGAGSRGVRLFETAEEALQHVRQASDINTFSEIFEFEEFIEGPIWHIDGYLYSGKPVVIKTNKYIGTCLDYKYGQSLGSIQFDHPALESWTIECLTALGSGNFTFHLEAIMTMTGPVFLEVAARAGGGDIVEIIERDTGINLHVLDMATETNTENKLAEHFAKIRPHTKKYGFFIIPGHFLQGDPCEIIGADELLKSSLVENYHKLTSGAKTPKKATYQSLDVPLSGIVSDESSKKLEEWMQQLFSQVKVCRLS